MPNVDHIKYLAQDDVLNSQLMETSNSFSANPEHHVTNIDLEIILSVSESFGNSHKGTIYTKWRESFNL